MSAVPGSSRAPTARPPIPVRRLFVAAVAMAAVAAALLLGLSPAGLRPGTGGLALAADFLGSAFTPAFDYEDRSGLPAGARPFLGQVAAAAIETVRVATTAVSLSILGGLVVGFFGSPAWWPDRPGILRRSLWLAARAAMTLTRSIHELIWATLFLAAFGLTPLTAILAIAIPYTGTLAKIFSEMCDEAPPDTRAAYRALGASPLQFYFLGLTPRLIPELVSYSLYRFECGLRSAAVLGFLGIPTLGYHLKLAFENAHNREVWTYLIALFLLVIAADQWSGAMRRRLSGSGPAQAGGASPVVPPVPAVRPPAVSRVAHDPFVRASLAAIAILVAWAWASGPVGAETGPASANFSNLGRFLSECRPWPIQQGAEGVGPVVEWMRDLLAAGGARAALNTLGISIVAIVLAAAAGWMVLPFAARNLASPHPFLLSSWQSHFVLRWFWWALAGASRFGLIFLRAIPEYIWAFLFLAMVSSQLWAAVLALAVHNAGILGRLGAEIIENADPGTPRAIRALGATRSRLLAFGLFPAAFPRFLVYFFYRWETCLRESTVLGLLGVATLGRLIASTRAQDRYDEMIFFVLLGAVLVFIGDLVSALARRAVRL